MKTCDNKECETKIYDEYDYCSTACQDADNGLTDAEDELKFYYNFL